MKQFKEKIVWSISACVFYVFMNIYIHRVCVYKWAYCWVEKNTDLHVHVHVPTLIFSILLCQHKKKNCLTRIFFGSMNMPCDDEIQDIC